MPPIIKYLTFGIACSPSEMTDKSARTIETCQLWNMCIDACAWR